MCMCPTLLNEQKLKVLDKIYKYLHTAYLLRINSNAYYDLFWARVKTQTQTRLRVSLYAQFSLIRLLFPIFFQASKLSI